MSLIDQAGKRYGVIFLVIGAALRRYVIQRGSQSFFSRSRCSLIISSVRVRMNW